MSTVLVVLSALLVPLATVLLALRWAEVPISTRWIALQTLSPVGGLLAVVALAAALAARSIPSVVLALVPTFLAGVLTWPTIHRTTVDPGPHDLTVLSANLELGKALSADVMAEVRRRDPDVVVLVEVTPKALERLDRAGLASAYPHRMGEAGPRASGLVVMSRHPMSPVPVYSDGRALTPYATLHAPGGDVIVRGVHPSAPTSAEVWRSDLVTLQRWFEGLDPGAPLIVAGDFNATFSHPVFRRAVDGLTDTARAAGRGWNPTWPEGRTVPPFAEIDHVLVRHVDVVDAGSAAVGQTDHRLVWARLRLRG